MKKGVFFLLVALLWGLEACVPVLQGDAFQGSTAVLSPTSVGVVAEPGPSNTPVLMLAPTTLPTATLIKIVSTNLPDTSLPTETQTPLPAASRTPKPSPTAAPSAWPTPVSLPPAPEGWTWRLQATAIPVTHYIINELSAADEQEPKERPYGLNDHPLPNIEPLPHRFLMETAYQGSGRLPNGHVLQYAAVRPPVARGLVPFRYVITPSERCGGHPLAGNGTCSVPLKTAATTWRQGEEPLVPVGSTIFIPELNMKIRINDVAISDGPPKIDLYTGTVNNYDYERPDGATIWILEEEED